jgi:molybdopterin molybdotransferase
VRVVRPLLLRLAGALPEPLVPVPARATFNYKKKKDRREYLRVSARVSSDGVIELEKYPYEGAGLLASLTGTDGLAEISEDVTNIAPGDMLGYLPYSILTN